MVCDERDFRYKVTFKIWRHATKIKAVRYFDNLIDAQKFAEQWDDASIRRVQVSVADMIIVGERIYGR